MDGIRLQEFNQIKQWMSQNQEQIPQDVSSSLSHLLDTYWSLTKAKQGHLEILARLRELMGFRPKSERGDTKPKYPDAI